jgi:RNA polymerase sigma-70 factor (ECF subfamily)
MVHLSVVVAVPPRGAGGLCSSWRRRGARSYLRDRAGKTGRSVDANGGMSAVAIAMQDTPVLVDARGPDPESQEWLDALSGSGREHDAAVARLHALLLRAARFEIARRRVGDRRSAELDDLATQAAADAHMAIMRKLHTYRGDSRFTTWAYKFALLEAAVKVRRRAWEDREVPLEDEGWAQLADRRAAPDTDAETAELIDAVRRGIAEALTPHQRTVLIAVTLNDVPIDVLAERLSTTRGALYKTLHDGRKKLRAQLAANGHAVDYLREGGTS